MVLISLNDTEVEMPCATQTKENLVCKKDDYLKFLRKKSLLSLDAVTEGLMLLFVLIVVFGKDLLTSRICLQ